MTRLLNLATMRVVDWSTVMEVLVGQTVAAPWLGEGALAGLTGFLISAWLNEWVVSGKLYRASKEEAMKRVADELVRSAKELDAAQKEIEYWRGIAMTSLGQAERAGELAGKLVEARR